MVDQYFVRNYPQLESDITWVISKYSGVDLDSKQDMAQLCRIKCWQVRNTVLTRTGYIQVINRCCADWSRSQRRIKEVPLDHDLVCVDKYSSDFWSWFLACVPPRDKYILIPLLEYGSCTAAAKHLGIARPVVWRYIQRRQGYWKRLWDIYYG